MLTACDTNDNTDKNSTYPEDKLQVVSSIKPLHAIVLAIAGEYAQSQQLIPDYATPHDYSFKPSDIRKMKSADVIFRVDEQLELQLNAVFENLHSSTPLISLAATKGLKLLEASENEHNHTDHSKYENIDFHIWASPQNTSIIAAQVAKTLSELDAKNANYYQQNLAIFRKALVDESRKISNTLAVHQQSKYIVFHNSWQYFANEFGLQKPIVVDLHEGVSSGAKTLKNIRSRVSSENIRCVFYDASVSEARLKVLAEKTKTAKVDVLANNITIDQSTYITWLHQLAKQVDACLAN